MTSQPSPRSHAYFNPFSNTNIERDDDGLLASRPPILPHARIKPQPIRIMDSLSQFSLLPIQGQGTIAISATNASKLVIKLSRGEDTTNYLSLVVSEDECYFSIGEDPETGTQIQGDIFKNNRNTLDIDLIKHSCYLRPDATDLYWLSLDRASGILRYGKKYLNAGLTLYEAKLKHKASEDRMEVWKDQQYQFLDHVDYVQVLQVGGDMEALRVAVQPLPIVNTLSPFVISGQSITLDDLASGVYTVPENLPPECQKLYHNVAGPNIALDTADFPEFSAAIQRSVNTPGLIGHTLLKAKATEFGKEDFDGTYLRITLGHDLGDSPGPPYVLEIWPAQHYSPIHDHGNSFAVIKVLHGEINAYFYDSLNLSPRVLGPPARLKRGDITWISDTHYQVHQLHNESTDGTVCCTIQCYLYGKEDTKHDEYFEYLVDVDGDSVMDRKGEFKPDSDYEFIQFKQDIKKEWEQRNK